MRTIGDGRQNAPYLSFRRDLLLEHVDELAELESLDNGKSVGVARAADVPLAADLFHYMAGWATKLSGHQALGQPRGCDRDWRGPWCAYRPAGTLQTPSE